MIDDNENKNKGIEMETVKVTKKEMEFLNAIANSDFSDDGYGFGDYVSEDEGNSGWGYDMRVVRGLIPSLVEKGIIEYDDDVEGDGSGLAWAGIDGKFRDEKNNTLINIEVA